MDKKDLKNIENINYKFPSIDLLDSNNTQNNKISIEEIEKNKLLITEVLKYYKLKVNKINVIEGPLVSLYEITFIAGTKLSKILNLLDDIVLSLGILGTRIEKVPEKNAIGIEMPNRNSSKAISIQTCIESKEFQESKHKLPIIIGKSFNDKTYIIDLVNTSNVLISGISNREITNMLDVIITSLLYKKSPEQLKFVMIDLNKLDLSLYRMLNNSFLATLPNNKKFIISDINNALKTLEAINTEIDHRVSLLEKALEINIEEYNKKIASKQLLESDGHKYLPYIVVIVNEFSHFSSSRLRDFEIEIVRASQIGGKVGVHLILTTQHTDTKYITGIIKANFPTRIAFKVRNMINSRTIIDAPGADKLLGNGDLLLPDYENDYIYRIQSPNINKPELLKILDFIENQKYTSTYKLYELQ